MGISNSTNGKPEETSDTDTSGESLSMMMKTTIASIHVKYPAAINCSTSDLDEWLKPSSERNVILLDARPEEEYVISHLEGSKRVDWEKENMAELSTYLDEKLRDKSSPTVVAYCSVGYRSSAVVVKLKDYYKASGKQPIPEMYNMAGSLFQWANEGRPMVDSNGEKTIFAHPYSIVWGKLLYSHLRKTAV